MERPINYKTVKCTCSNCGKELEDGTTCYQLDDIDIYCESCFESCLIDFKKECETKAESEVVEC